MVAYISFDDGKATECVDALRTVSYGGPNAVGGVAGLALAFDGIDDFIELPVADKLSVLNEPSSLTIALWVLIDQAATSQAYPLVSRGLGDVINFNFRLWSGGDALLWNDNLQFFWREATDTDWCLGYTDADTFLPAATWRHVAVVASWNPDGTGSVQFFVDGEAAKVNPLHPAPLCTYAPPMQERTGITTLGRRIGERDPEFLKGTMDELRIWRAALTAAELKQQIASDKI